jgi:hypothetical protein
MLYNALIISDMCMKVLKTTLFRLTVVIKQDASADR